MDRIDEAYNGLMGEEFMRKTRERLHWICSKVAGEKILDVGCSQGTLARLLASTGKSVLGVDINEDAIAYAEGKLAGLDDSSRRRLRFATSNFMDFKSEALFDTVVMGEVLEHLPDPAAFVNKAWNHLAKGGTFVATVPFGINDDPDHRQTFYWSWIKDVVAPLFDIADIEFFGKWIGVVGIKRERKAAIEKTVPLAVVKELEKAFYAIERPLVNDVKASGLRMQAQKKDIDETRKNLAAKTAEAKTAAATGNEQKTRADKAVADYAKLKADLTAEIAKQKDAVANAVAAKNASDAAAAKQKTVLEGEVARQKTALAAEQTKVKDLNSKLAAARNELAATKNESLELRINLDAEKKMSDGRLDQISVLKAALQFAANRPLNDSNETKLLEYSQEVRELRSALEAKRDEAVERAERLGRLAGQVESLKTEKELLSSRVAELSAMLSAERESAKAKDAEIAARDALVAEAGDYAKLCEGKNTKLAGENKALAASIEALKSEKDALAEALKAAESEKERKDAAIQRMTGERATLEQTVAVLERDARTRDDELAGTRGEIDRLGLALDETSGELQREKKMAERMSETLDKLRKQLKEADGKSAAQSAKLAKADTDNKILSSKAAELQQSLSALRNQHEELKKAKTKAVRLHDAKSTRLKEALASRKEISAKYKNLSARYKSVLSSYESIACSKLGRLALFCMKKKNGKGMAAEEASSIANMPDSIPAVESPAGETPSGAESSPAAAKTKAGIRVLFPCGSGNNPGANPFVATLMESMKDMGIDAAYGADLLFKDELPFDIVHFMWPEALWGWSHSEICERSYAKLEQIISRLKTAGTVIAYTRHNTRPHVDDNPFLAKAYELVENSSDIVFHMGEYSRKEFMSSHPASVARHVVVPHHTYARIPRTVTKKEAREWFGLSDDDRVVLSFGVFRSEDEQRLLVEAAMNSRVEKLKVLAPRFPHPAPGGIISLPSGHSVPEQALPLYFAAADVVFIQRRHILNSGNLPMAFHFGCACVGPDDGDVGEILKATGNPVFNPDNPTSAGKAIFKAFAAIDKYKRGVKNRIWADGNWKQDVVASKIVSEYRNALQGKDEDSAKPLVSVVVDRCMNDKDGYRRTKCSIDAQTYPRERIQLIGSANPKNALAEAKGEFTVFLLEGDELTSGFIEKAVRPFRNANVDCVVTSWKFPGADAVQTYAGKIVERCDEGVCIDSRQLEPLAACAFGKVFRTSAAAGNAAVLGLLGEIRADASCKDLATSVGTRRTYVLKAGESYIPSRATEYDRLLGQMAEIPQLLTDGTVPTDVKRTMVGRMQMATDRIRAGIAALPEKQREKARAAILSKEKDNVFFNRSLFGGAKAVAFCHNFPPAIDASSLVSAKRLREIDRLEGEILDWTVVSQDMRSIRPVDLDFQLFHADMQSSRHLERKGKFGFAPVLQQPYADFAAAAAEEIRPKVIYSRAFFIGSHMAAYEYKKAHPEVKWYAEFSDPVAYAVDNTVRACPDKGPTWFDTEKMVYELADVVIFTNEKQRSYMLGYNRDEKQNERVMRRSVVMRQPVLAREYCWITPYSYPMDEDRINIGYFGTFYKNRTGDDMMKLLENKSVTLHVFTTKPEDMADQCARYGEQIRINHTVSHLEFLNLGSKFDYLFLSDATFTGGDNPFLPSKYADYMATGTMIIAKVQRGSTLSETENDRLIKTEEITGAFAASLKKKRP